MEVQFIAVDLDETGGRVDHIWLFPSDADTDDISGIVSNIAWLKPFARHNNSQFILSAA